MHKNLRATFAVFILSIVSLITVKTYQYFIISSDLKNDEKYRLKKSAEVLNECFDLKNKSQRTLNESMKLIEYCLEVYGSEK